MFGSKNKCKRTFLTAYNTAIFCTYSDKVTLMFNDFSKYFAFRKIVE